MSQLSHLLKNTTTNGLKQALCAAVALDKPACAALVAAGIPHYNASAIIKRLQSVDEIRDDAWDEEARAEYQRAIEQSEQTAAAKKTDKKQLAQTPLAEQPREKARHFGIQQLANPELLALLLRTGNSQEGVLEMSQRILLEHDGLLGLADLDVEELIQAEGLGPAKATEIAAAFELGRRLAQAKRAQRPVLRQPEDIAALLAPEMAPLRHEELWCLALDTHSRLIGEPRVISRGDIDGTDAGPRAFFRRALHAGAASAIAVHNHPSGNPEASQADLAVTHRLRDAGNLLDVPLQDHLIIGDGGAYYSIRRSHPHLFR